MKEVESALRVGKDWFGGFVDLDLLVRSSFPEVAARELRSFLFSDLFLGFVVGVGWWFVCGILALASWLWSFS